MPGAYDSQPDGSFHFFFFLGSRPFPSVVLSFFWPNVVVKQPPKSCRCGRVAFLTGVAVSPVSFAPLFWASFPLGRFFLFCLCSFSAQPASLFFREIFFFSPGPVCCYWIVGRFGSFLLMCFSLGHGETLFSLAFFHWSFSSRPSSLEVGGGDVTPLYFFFHFGRVRIFFAFFPRSSPPPPPR